MKARHIFLSVATGMLIVAGSGASADDKWLGDRGSNWEEHVKSFKSRAEVVAELNEARAQGLVGNVGDANYPSTPVAKSTRSRDEVRAEGAQAARNPNRAIEYSGS